MIRPNSNGEVHLDPDQVQQVFPVTPRDRRENADLFSPFIEKVEFRDNARFYKALSGILRERLDVIHEYDSRMVKKRDGRKAFGSRALRHLQQSIGSSLSLEEIADLPADRFDDKPIEAALVYILKRLLAEPEDPAREVADDNPILSQVSNLADWRSLATELAWAVTDLTSPDPTSAARIVALANSLNTACEAAAAVSAEKNLESTRQSLVERICAIDPALGAAAATGVRAADSETLETLANAIEAAETAEVERAQAIAEWEDLGRQFSEANDREDFDLQEKLLPLRRRSQTTRDAASAGAAESLDAVKELLSIGNVDTSLPTIAKPADEEAPIEHAEEESLAPSVDEVLSVVPSAADAPASSPATSESPPESDFGLGAPSDVAETDANLGGTKTDSAELAPIPATVPPEPEAPEGGHTAETDGLDRQVAHYLRLGEPALAWHLANLAEETGQRPTLHSQILKAVAITSSFSRPEDMADPAKLEILTAAVSTLAAVEAGPDRTRTELARTLVLAALLRPALFDMNNVARSNLARLQLEGRLARYAPLVASLVDLGFEVRIAAEDLAGYAGTERQKKLPAATAALKEWLETARTRKTVHQPTYSILHWQLARQGDLGQVFEGVLANAPDAVRKATELVERLLNNRAAQEHFVSESEIQSGRPRRSRIEGMALDWFCDRIQQGCEHLREWLNAQIVDQDRSAERQFASLAARIGNLRKLVSEVVDPTEVEEGSLLAAAQQTLARSLAVLAAILDGREVTRKTPRVRSLLEEPLLHLPGGCQPRWEQGEAFAEERAAQKKRLFIALRQCAVSTGDLGAVFSQRLREHAILAAGDLLAIMRRQQTDETELSHRQQELDEDLLTTRVAARENVERLRQDLATFMNLELGLPGQVRAELDRIEAIAVALDVPIPTDSLSLPALNNLRQPEVPPDFPELTWELSRIGSFRDALRERIRMEQRERLGALANERETAASAQAVLQRIDTLDPVTVDDMIADLQAGRSPTALDVDKEDDFSRFYPSIAAALSKDGELNRGRVLRAIDERSSLGPMNFSLHDEHEVLAAKRLIETWAEAENGLRQGTVHKLHDAMERLFGLLGFTRVRFANGRELVPGRLRSLQLACDVPNADHWFLPPAFGSEAGGSYPVLVARPDVSQDQLASELGRLAPDQASFLIVFGKLSPSRRQALARVLRRDRRVVLLVDESLVLFLAASRGNLMERLFNCAMPFAWVQPYTTNPGMIPPEMFFGRREEMAKIVARSASGCLVYGGRQLGKSALLNHIRRQHHRPESGQIAIYLDIKPIGDVAMPAERIWMELGHVLHLDKIAPDRETDPRVLEVAIRKWLQEKPDRRLLVMLDEADRFLRSEHATGYPNLQRLKSLMESTNWRFKVVFAGLHNVRRMAQAPNSPLVHFGDAICIGPMNATVDNQVEARRLAVAPMRAAGFEYDPPSLAWDMLARMNHYPSLVQVFCKSVIETAGSQSRPVGEGPRWLLGRETLFEGRAAQLISEEIRKRFQWTLDLDPRYDLLAKCIALHRFDSGDGYAAVLRRGLSVPEVDALVGIWWPQRLERLRIGDLEELLREMVDLGVLGTAEKGRFGLRNSHIAQMLGQRADIERDILALSEREADVDYDAATFHRRIRTSDGMPRSPLTDRALEQLFNFKAPGIRIVVAAPRVVGANAAGRIATLARDWSQVTESAAQVQNPKSAPGELRSLIEKAKKGSHVVVAECKWDRKVADWLAQQRSIRDGRILLIWVVPPDSEIGSDVNVSGVVVFRPRPWSEAMLRHWLREEGFNALDDRATRQLIMDATGGAPERLSGIRPLLQDLTTDSMERRAERLREWSKQHPVRPQDVGLPPELLPSLSELASFGDIQERGELVDLLGDAGSRLAEVMVPLNLAEPMGRDGARLTPLGRLLAA